MRYHTLGRQTAHSGPLISGTRILCSGHEPGRYLDRYVNTESIAVKFETKVHSGDDMFLCRARIDSFVVFDARGR